MEKLLVKSNFSFSHNVFHSYISLVCQNAVSCGNGPMPILKNCGKGENTVTSIFFLIFFNMFYAVTEKRCTIWTTVKLSSANALSFGKAKILSSGSIFYWNVMCRNLSDINSSCTRLVDWSKLITFVVEKFKVDKKKKWENIVGKGKKQVNFHYFCGQHQGWLVISVYLSSLPVAHLSDAPRRRLVVTGDSARIQVETTENSAWFFNVLGV